MDRAQAKKFQPVIDALAAGKAIEYYDPDDKTWTEASEIDNFRLQWRVVDPANKWRDAQAAGKTVEMRYLALGGKRTQGWDPVPDFCTYSNLYEYRIRHRWQDAINAVSAGKTIESRLIDYKGKPGNWYKVEVPANYVYNWDEPDVEFRVFDGLRQWKEALASGKKVQYRHGLGDWIDVLLPFPWSESYYYRLKPEYRPFRAEEILLNQCCIGTRHPDIAKRDMRTTVSSVRPSSATQCEMVSIAGIGGLSFAKFLEFFDLCSPDGKNLRPAGVLEEETV